MKKTVKKYVGWVVLVLMLFGVTVFTAMQGSQVVSALSAEEASNEIPYCEYIELLKENGLIKDELPYSGLVKLLQQNYKDTVMDFTYNDSMIVVGYNENIFPDIRAYLEKNGRRYWVFSCYAISEMPQSLPCS